MSKIVYFCAKFINVTKMSYSLRNPHKNKENSKKRVGKDKKTKTSKLPKNKAKIATET